MRRKICFNEELASLLKGLKNNNTPGADSVVNEFFFKYSGCEVRNKLQKTMNMMYEKGKSLAILVKT